MNKNNIVDGLAEIVGYNAVSIMGKGVVQDTRKNRMYSHDEFLSDLNVLKKAYKVVRKQYPELDLYSRWSDILMCPKECEKDYTLIFAHILVESYEATK